MAGNPPSLPGSPPAEPSGDVRDPALLHETGSTRTYPCRTCGGELEFHIGQQQLVCPHCGNEQDLEPGDGEPVEEQDLREAVAALRAGAAERDHQQVVDEKEVVCQNCGGHTTFSGSLTSTRCPYCATPVQRDDVHDAPARLPVDGIVPFQVDEAAARKAIRRWMRSRWFAPKEFKKYGRAGEFSSVYMAFFTYDAETTTDYAGRRGDRVTRGHGEDRRTEIRWRPVSGQVHTSFDDVVVHANTGLNPRHVSALEPWPTQQALPFSAEYVAGHLCRTYDRDVEECFGDAREIIDGQITQDIRRDIGGAQQQITRRRTHYHSLSYKHLLLPLWLLTVMFEGCAHQVMINGVTGEVKGQRPWSKVKIALAGAAALVVVAGLLVLGRAMGAG